MTSLTLTDSDEDTPCLCVYGSEAQGEGVEVREGQWGPLWAPAVGLLGHYLKE